MKKTMNVRLYTGLTNSELLVSYCYTYQTSDETQYPTVKQTPNGNIVINQKYGLSISEGFNKNQVYIPKTLWSSFVVLLKKTVKTVSDNLYEIFPDINKSEFSIDSRVMERFQTEKACSTAGMSMIPAVWIDSSGTCYPALRLNTIKFGTCVIPFEDAIVLSSKLNKIDPEAYGLSLMSIMSKFK